METWNIIEQHTHAPHRCWTRRRWFSSPRLAPFGHSHKGKRRPTTTGGDVLNPTQPTVSAYPQNQNRRVSVYPDVWLMCQQVLGPVLSRESRVYVPNIYTYTVGALAHLPVKRPFSACIDPEQAEERTVAVPNYSLRSITMVITSFHLVIIYSSFRYSWL